MFTGERFAVYQVKTGLAQVLKNYKIEVCEKTEIPLKFNPTAFLHVPKNGIHLKFVKLEKEEVTRL